MIRRPPRSTLSSSSAASDVYKRQSSHSAQTPVMMVTDFSSAKSIRTIQPSLSSIPKHGISKPLGVCLLYTSDAADEEDSVDLGGRSIIKKKKQEKKKYK